MRFLCLPGAYGSAKNFEVQLAPFTKELRSSHSADFFFTEGTVSCHPPDGFLDYFGPGPHYRFVEYDGIKQNDVLERVRDFPEGEDAESVLRELLSDGESRLEGSIERALDALYRTIDEHGPFDGIVAYSEGTVIGSTLILDEQRRAREEGRPRMIKRAVFFNGWPPLNPETYDIILADTTDAELDVPTVHCVGAGDPYLAGAMALYNVCDPDSAYLFDHGKGHTIPRDAQTIGELGDVVRKMGGAVF